MQTLKAARVMGDFLLVGIHSDQIVRCRLSNTRFVEPLPYVGVKCILSVAWHTCL